MPEKLLIPTEQEKTFSQQDDHHVQRPPGAGDAGGVKGVNVMRREIGKYSGERVTPEGFREIWLATAAAGAAQTFPFEDGLEFIARTLFADNWTNQWLYEDNIKRYIPPYSGGWIFAIPKGAQKAQVRLKVPAPSYVPAAAIAGEFAWLAWGEAFTSPQSGIIDRTLAAAISNSTIVDNVAVSNRTYIDGDSGNQANAVATATLAANAATKTWITGFEVTGTGATGVLVVTVTVTGVVNGPLHYTYTFVAGATTQNQSLIVEFPFPIPTAAVNTAIVVSCPASGAGGLNNTVVAHGFQE